VAPVKIALETPRSSPTRDERIVIPAAGAGFAPHHRSQTRAAPKKLASLTQRVTITASHQASHDFQGVLRMSRRQWSRLAGRSCGNARPRSSGSHDPDNIFLLALGFGYGWVSPPMALALGWRSTVVQESFAEQPPTFLISSRLVSSGWAGDESDEVVRADAVLFIAKASRLLCPSWVGNISGCSASLAF
jgi:hypothetical protein